MGHFKVGVSVSMVMCIVYILIMDTTIQKFDLSMIFFILF